MGRTTLAVKAAPLAIIILPTLKLVSNVPMTVINVIKVELASNAIYLLITETCSRVYLDVSLSQDFMTILQKLL